MLVSQLHTSIQIISKGQHLKSKYKKINSMQEMGSSFLKRENLDTQSPLIKKNIYKINNTQKTKSCQAQHTEIQNMHKKNCLMSLNFEGEKVLIIKFKRKWFSYKVEIQITPLTEHHNS